MYYRSYCPGHFWNVNERCIWFFSSTEIKYSWVFNGQRSFLQQDPRRFISQKTGNLYIAKVEASDAGNYTCAVRNMMTNATVFSSPTPVVVRRDGKSPQFASAASWLSCTLNWHAAGGRASLGDKSLDLSVTLFLLLLRSMFFVVFFIAPSRSLGTIQGYACEKPSLSAWRRIFT